MTFAHLALWLAQGIGDIYVPPALPDVPESVYTDSFISFRYPAAWKIYPQASFTLIAPLDAKKTSSNGETYYSCGIAVGTYRPEDGTRFDVATKQLITYLQSSNPGLNKRPDHSTESGWSRLPTLLDGRDAIITGLYNPTIMPGDELTGALATIFNSDRVEYVWVFSPLSQVDKYDHAFHRVLGTLRVGSTLRAEEIAATASKSVVVLVAEKGKRSFTLGTAFAVAPGIFATNSHVLGSSVHVFIKLPRSSDYIPVAEIVARDPDTDLALIYVPTASLPPLGLADDEPPLVGERVYAIGNPKGLEGTFSEGVVSGVRGDGAVRHLQITAPISPGSSGGPVLNASGRVVGITVATYQSGQNLNFAIPVSHLRRLMSSSLPPK